MGGIGGTVKTYLAGLIGLGALYLVGTQGKGLAAAFGGAQKFVSGTEATAIGR
ncbi:MAG TPA: hypothetical protein VGS06_27170 [Streptosporangiaceae bacterium]|nr:hypothetical protein [Streptosporangiaceae bacterium]